MILPDRLMIQNHVFVLPLIQIPGKTYGPGRGHGPPRSAPGRLLSGEHTHSHHITMMHFITSPWWLHPFTIFHGCRDSGCNKRRVAFNELPRNGWPACTLQESRVVSIHPLDVPDPPKLSMSFAHKTHRSDHPSAHCSPLFYVYYMSTA